MLQLNPRYASNLLQEKTNNCLYLKNAKFARIMNMEAKKTIRLDFSLNFSIAIAAKKEITVIASSKANDCQPPKQQKRMLATSSKAFLLFDGTAQ